MLTQTDSNRTATGWNAILSNLHFADRSTDFPTDEAGSPCDKCPVGQRNWDIQGFQDL